jgi:hypothetical protein
MFGSFRKYLTCLTPDAGTVKTKTLPVTVMPFSGIGLSRVGLALTSSSWLAAGGGGGRGDPIVNV